MSSTGSCSRTRSDQQGRAREDTRGRLQAPARSTQTPISTLRRSHFPDPPAPTLPAQKALDQTVLRPVPDALPQRRPAAVVKRSLLDDGEDRRTIDRREQTFIDIEGSQMIALAEHDSAVDADVAGGGDRRADWIYSCGSRSAGVASAPVSSLNR